MSAPLPHDPPEGGCTVSNVSSFKDKLVSAKQGSYARKRVDLLQENLARMELLGGDRLYLFFSFDKDILEKISLP